MFDGQFFDCKHVGRILEPWREKNLHLMFQTFYVFFRRNGVLGFGKMIHRQQQFCFKQTIKMLRDA